MTCPIIISDLSYLTLGDESTWGTVPGSPDYVYCPVGAYGVQLQTEHRKSSTFTGKRQPVHTKKRRGAPQGQITSLLYGWVVTTATVSLAEYLCTWAFDGPDDCERTSKFAEWAEGPNISNRRHTRLRVSQASLTGDESSGQVQLAMDVLGKDEATFATAQAVPDDLNGLVDFAFEDVVLTVGGTALSITSFNFTVNHNLAIRYNNSNRPTYLLPQGEMDITFSAVMTKEDDTYQALNRAAADSDLVGSLVLTGSHEGTGATGDDTRLTIAMPKMTLQNPENSFSRGQDAQETLNWVVRKPDTSADAYTLTFDEV